MRAVSITFSVGIVVAAFIFAIVNENVYRECAHGRGTMLSSAIIEWSKTLGHAERQFHAGRISQKTYYEMRDKAYRVYLPKLDAYKKVTCS